MPLSLEQYIKQLVESGLVELQVLQQFIPPDAIPKDAEELALELIRKKKLTKFQAQEISKGRGKALVLGNYVLAEKIGQGGMGAVYRAEHRRMKRTVAIKMLPTNLMKDAVAAARFQREIEAAAKLRHPNIVAADDADEANGVHFLVMEHVDGSDLSALVKKEGPLSLEQAVNYVVQAAKGLQAAHAEGIVHRDIKPANLLLDKKGTVKILDLGLARLSEESENSPHAELTSTGAIMGTVDYMPPEQALDTKSADARADIYALGCTLYYLLVGKPLYDGNSVMKKLLAHREQPIPSLRAERAEVSDRLESIFKKMVAKKVEDRYQTMSEVIAALESKGPLPAQPTDWQRSPPPSVVSSEPDQTTLFKDASSIETKVIDTNSGGVGSNNRKRMLIGTIAVCSLLLLASLLLPARKKNETQGGRVAESNLSATPIPPVTSLEKKPASVVPVAGGKPWDAPEFQQWEQQVVGLTAEMQIEEVVKRLQQLNPEFEGKVTNWDHSGPPAHDNGVVTEFAFVTDRVRDISPLRALKGLKRLRCHGSSPNQGILVDLSPLRGLQLTELDCGWSRRLKDLSPLRGMTLERLQIPCTQVDDLSPLKGMPLAILFCEDTLISDLSPLEGMPLELIQIHFTLISDLSPLKKSKISVLDLEKTRLADLSSLRGLSLTKLNCNLTSITSLEPLGGMPLVELSCRCPKLQDLSPLQGMNLENLDINSSGVVNLSPLHGIPLKTLNCGSTRVTDFSPLEGSALQHLYCDGAEVSDLAPLKNIPLTILYCERTRVTDLSALGQLSLSHLRFTPSNISAGLDVIRRMKTLESIGPGWQKEHFSPAEFWRRYDDGQFGRPITKSDDPAFLKWVNEIGELSAEKQIMAVTMKLQELHPGFDGALSHKIEDGAVTQLQLNSGVITDLSPLRALKNLKILNCRNTGDSLRMLANLAPLQGMQLTSLRVDRSDVVDLSPLKGMPLTILIVGDTHVFDLTPIEGMSLNALGLWRTPVDDLSIIKGMPLKHLMIDGTRISDLSLLQGFDLKGILLTPHTITKGITVLRQMKNLELIGMNGEQNYSPAEFWKRYDAGDFGPPSLQ